VRYKLLTAFAILRSFALAQVVLANGEGLSPQDAFVGYLVFDALIGNTDRHHENWGITDGRYCLRRTTREPTLKPTLPARIPRSMGLVRAERP
jgi:hypothetical protein